MKQMIYPNRTQISLSEDLKNMIIARGNVLGESLSEYLRKAALVRMSLDDVEKNELSLIAKAVAGTVPKSKSGWKNVKDIGEWQRNLRKNEDRHRP